MCQDVPVSPQIFPSWRCQVKQTCTGRTSEAASTLTAPQPKVRGWNHHRHKEETYQRVVLMVNTAGGESLQRPRLPTTSQSQKTHIQEGGERLGSWAWGQSKSLQWNAVGWVACSLAFWRTYIQAQRLRGLVYDCLAVHPRSTKAVGSSPHSNCPTLGGV